MAGEGTAVILSKLRRTCTWTYINTARTVHRQMRPINTLWTEAYGNIAFRFVTQKHENAACVSCSTAHVTHFTRTRGPTPTKHNRSVLPAFYSIFIRTYGSGEMERGLTWHPGNLPSSKDIPSFMEPVGTLPCSQNPALYTIWYLVHTLTSYTFMIQFNIILSSSKWYFTFKFSS
jgi:hypothetical protein